MAKPDLEWKWSHTRTSVWRWRETCVVFTVFKRRRGTN